MSIYREMHARLARTGEGLGAAVMASAMGDIREAQIIGDQEVLRSLVGSQMYCKACGEIMDVGDAVLFRAEVDPAQTEMAGLEVPTRSFALLCCGGCWDSINADVEKIAHERQMHVIEVIDGRSFWDSPRKKRAQRARSVSAVSTRPQGRASVSRRR